MTAARQRLRPIIMTSLAFGLGVVPLFLANGPGSGSQNAIGTSVVGGVLTATFLGIFFIPMFYIWVRSMFPYKGNEAHNGKGDDDNHPSGNGSGDNPLPSAPTEDKQSLTPPASYQPVSLGDNTQ